MNWDGSSWAMKANIAMDMTKTIDANDNYCGSLCINHLVTADNSTIMRLLQHKSANKNGQFLDAVPAPIFLADPSH